MELCQHPQLPWLSATHAWLESLPRFHTISYISVNVFRDRGSFDRPLKVEMQLLKHYNSGALDTYLLCA